MMDFRDNMQKCQEYVQALEQEKTKIQVFQRELPLCLQLVTQAIEACKQQLSGTTTMTECFNGHSECSEQTTSNGPVLEEFIPIKKSHSSDNDDDDDEEHECDKPLINHNNDINPNISTSDKSGKKSDWLRSVQLWNQTSDPPTNQEDHIHQPKKVAVVEVKRSGGGAFHLFQKEKISNNNNNEIINEQHGNINISIKPKSMPAASACSSAEAADTGSGSGSGCGGGSKKEEKGGQSQRKARRCWSPELHRRFLHALQQLGGSHVATPKQIREFMKVDGLTNDEVKSHLQKYRLHTRRPSSAVHNNNATPQTPQFVVVGGIWVPPQEYNTVPTSGDTTAVAPANGIYAPVATVGAAAPHSPPNVTHGQQQKQSSHSRCDDSRSPSGGGAHSNSPSTSSSIHTTQACHAY